MAQVPSKLSARSVEASIRRLTKELDTQGEAISLLRNDNQTKRDEIETLFVPS